MARCWDKLSDKNKSSTPTRARDALNEVKGHRGMARCWDKLSDKK